MKNLFPFLFFFALPLMSQTDLFPGDLVFVSVNADGDKSFAFVFLRDVEATTVVRFTDCAWVSAEEAFRDTEGTMVWTAASDVPKGQVVTCPVNNDSADFIEEGSFNPSGSGDNIIAYQGDPEDPFFVAGIGWARGSTVWDFDEVSANSRSDIPPGLSLADGTAVSLGTADNYLYTGDRYSLQGTRQQLLSELSNPAHFTSSNTDELRCEAASLQYLMREIRCSADEGGSDGQPVSWTEVSWVDEVPDRFADVAIAGKVLVDTEVTVHDLTIEAGGLVEILPGSSLTVMGELRNFSGSEGLLIRSDASGSGALFNASANVAATVHLYLSPNQWHFVSSPVSGSQSFAALFGTPGTHLYGVYAFHEVANEWRPLPDGDQTHPVSGQGYNVLYQGDPKTIIFVGVLNNFRFRSWMPVSRGAGGGWNLIGNPFPAPLAWGRSLPAQGMAHETIYVTTGGSGESTTWDTFNGASGIGVPDNQVGNIAMGQAMWVRADEGGGSIGMGHYAKTRGESRFKGGQQQRQLIRLTLSDQEGPVDQIALDMGSGDVGFDRFDSEKRLTAGGGTNEYHHPWMAVPVDGKYCVIASCPADAVIPLSLYIPPGSASENYLISLQQVSPIVHSPFILEDRLPGISQDLVHHPVYEFHSREGGLVEGRFFLRMVSRDIPDMDLTTGVDLQVEERQELIGYFDLMGRRYSELPRGVPGIFIKAYRVGGEIGFQKLFSNGID